MLTAASREGSMSGYHVGGWVMYDGRVRVESTSTVGIRKAYEAVRRYAIDCGWKVDFTLTAGAAKACGTSQRVRLDIRHDGFGSRTISTTNL